MEDINKTVSRTVELSDIDDFARLSGDHHPLHTDPEFAEATSLGGRIAHGMLTAALASGLLFDRGILDTSIKAFLEGTFRFTNPVRPGDVITDATSLMSSEPTKSGRFKTDRYRSEIRNQDGDVVLEAEWTFLREAQS